MSRLSQNWYTGFCRSASDAGSFILSPQQHVWDQRVRAVKRDGDQNRTTTYLTILDVLLVTDATVDRKLNAFATPRAGEVYEVQ
jgi:hypothetical protein